MFILGSMDCYNDQNYGSYCYVKDNYVSLS